MKQALSRVLSRLCLTACPPRLPLPKILVKRRPANLERPTDVGDRVRRVFVEGRDLILRFSTSGSFALDVAIKWPRSSAKRGAGGRPRAAEAVATLELPPPT